MARIFSIILSVLGFAAGNAQQNPQISGPLAKVVDKFAGVLAAGGGIWWLVGNRADVVSLNYLELAAVALIFNMAMKVDPPGPPSPQ